MKDFDPKRRERVPATVDERTFRIGGEEFVVAEYVRPETIAPIELIKPDSTIAEDLPLMDEIVEGFLQDEADVERWRELRKRVKDPLVYSDIEDVVVWLVGLTTRRPTGRPSDSTDGPPAGSTSSTEDSSSPGETAA